mgnify:CR=1 FL=1
MSTFIGCTIGLEANRGSAVGKLVKVEYNRLNSPQDAYSDVNEARWALDQCGWSLMSEDFANRE